MAYCYPLAPKLSAGATDYQHNPGPNWLRILRSDFRVARKKAQRDIHKAIIESIGLRIVAGNLRAGDLLRDSELRAAYSCSRTAIREAFRVLGTMGLLAAKTKVGTTVRSHEHWNYLDARILRWRLQSDDSNTAVAELYELRYLIEPMSAALAADNATRADIEAMSAAHLQMKAAGDDGEKIIVPDLAFHQALIAASGNLMFSSLAHIIGAALRVNFELVKDVPAGQVHSTLKHKKVLDAIKAHDRVAAQKAMQKLIEDSQRDAIAIRSSQKVRRRRVAKTRS
jgi:DNA-binding FadR family transcriptional regulator